MKEKINQIMNNPLFRQLEMIGGQQKFHQEGNALIHTILVQRNARILFDGDDFFIKVALLHDVGKIYTGRLKNDGSGDFKYPNHSGVGAEFLGEFISPDNEDFEEVKWFVKNHIKPLFWINKKEEKLRKEFEELLESAPSERCNISNLAKLAICDILGSKSEEPQTLLIKFLEKFI